MEVYEDLGRGCLFSPARRYLAYYYGSTRARTCFASLVMSSGKDQVLTKHTKSYIRDTKPRSGWRNINCNRCRGVPRSLHERDQMREAYKRYIAQVCCHAVPFDQEHGSEVQGWTSFSTMGGNVLDSAVARWQVWMVYMTACVGRPELALVGLQRHSVHSQYSKRLRASCRCPMAVSRHIRVRSG